MHSSSRGVAVATEPRETSIARVTFAPFRLAWRLILSLMLLWLTSTAIHIGYVRWYRLDPARHMEQLIGYYVEQAGGQDLPEKIAFHLHGLVLDRRAQRLLAADPPTPAQGDAPRVATGLRRGIWSTFRPDLVVAAYSTVLFGLKAGMTAMAATSFGLVVIVGGIDGLVQRHIRTACAGHESAALYHRAKFYRIKLLPAFAASVFFCSPLAFDPAWLFVPVTVLSAALLRLQAAYYKKYL